MHLEQIRLQAVLGSSAGPVSTILSGLENAECVSARLAPGGAPSDQVRIGTIDRSQVVFLPPGTWPRVMSIRRPRSTTAPISDVMSAGCHRPSVGFRLRAPSRRTCPGVLRAGGPVHRPHNCPREKFLRHGLRRPCLHGDTRQSEAGRCGRGGGRSRGACPRERRHLSGDGRSAILV
ncbi:UNVERIFIED_CONTAM: hypothetical protein GTU68_016309, partial [Idotea baltica]|nr:hypothetical protein [Idotea baltica]